MLRTILLICVSLSAAARADVWIGPMTASGNLLRPQEYVQTVAPLFRVTHTFEAMSTGVELSFTDLGGFTLASPTADALVAVRQGTFVAGARPASGTKALEILSPGGHPAKLLITLLEPVISVGFAAMSLDSPARLRIYGVDNALLTDYEMPAMVAGQRRWIGMAADGREITKVLIEPRTTSQFAIDDLEVGVHAPEPAGLAVMLPALAWVRRRGRQGI